MSLKDFENITYELSSTEKELLPLLVAKLAIHKGINQIVTNSKLRQYIFDRTGKSVNEARVRKIAQHIRLKGLITGLVAINKGYFIAESPEQIEDWLITMRQRRKAATDAIAAGERDLKQMTGRKQPNQYKQQKVNNSIIQPSLL